MTEALQLADELGEARVIRGIGALVMQHFQNETLKLFFV